MLTVANNRYFIGNFDGVTFTAIDDTVTAIMDITILHIIDHHQP